MDKHPANMDIAEKLAVLDKMSDTLHDLANSLGGTETGHFAVMLHGASTIVSNVQTDLKEWNEKAKEGTFEYPEGTRERMIEVIQMTKNFDVIKHPEMAGVKEIEMACIRQMF